MEPKIYVACLASYNAGTLHGEWIDATLDKDELMEEIKTKVLSTSKEPIAEEWAVHDYEDFGGSGLAQELGEYPDLEAISMHANALEEHGEAWVAFVDWQGVQYATVEGFEEAYQGQYTDAGDYAAQYTEDCGEPIPEHLKYYVDYEKMERDMELGGDIYRSEDGHVFINC